MRKFVSLVCLAAISISLSVPAFAEGSPPASQPAATAQAAAVSAKHSATLLKEVYFPQGHMIVRTFQYDGEKAQKEVNIRLPKSIYDRVSKTPNALQDAKNELYAMYSIFGLTKKLAQLDNTQVDDLGDISKLSIDGNFKKTFDEQKRIAYDYANEAQASWKKLSNDEKLKRYDTKGDPWAYGDLPPTPNEKSFVAKPGSAADKEASPDDPNKKPFTWWQLVGLVAILGGVGSATYYAMKKRR